MEVQSWLKSIGCAELVPLFSTHQLDTLELISSLEEQDICALTSGNMPNAIDHTDFLYCLYVYTNTDVGSPGGA
jgi:hypothetical protein